MYIYIYIYIWREIYIDNKIYRLYRHKDIYMYRYIDTDTINVHILINHTYIHTYIHTYLLTYLLTYTRTHLSPDGVSPYGVFAASELAFKFLASVQGFGDWSCQV